jgi:hypothetical protein
MHSFCSTWDLFPSKFPRLKQSLADAGNNLIPILLRDSVNQSSRSAGLTVRLDVAFLRMAFLRLTFALLLEALSGWWLLLVAINLSSHP